MSGDVQECRTLVELCRSRSALHPERQAYGFIAEGAADTTLSYRELDARARAIAAALLARGRGRARDGVAPRGERALLLYPPGLEFITAFMGCLYAGVVAVPAYPPDRARLERTLPRLRAIAADAGATWALTTSPILSATEYVLQQAQDLARLEWLATDAIDVATASSWDEPRLDGDSLAFLQYTSGSTAAPKGVMVSHANLLANEAVIARSLGHEAEEVLVSWLPVYHDMGLIGNVLQSLFVGGTCHVMSPLEFLQKPLSWLAAIERYRATTSGGPNFAYDLCVRRLSSGPDAPLDLSCWKVAFNGAEPVRADTLDRFANAFARFGFRRTAFFPCYGLAEATLFVSGADRERGPKVASFRADGLARGCAEAPESGRAADLRDFVSCGRTGARHHAVIVDPQSRIPCPDGRIGEIWVAGLSVAKGYWKSPEAGAETFEARLADGEGPFLRTGDLGFRSQGELFVAGRLKDLVIIRGRNHYPQDIERSAEGSHPAIRPGCAAAFSIERGGEERLVVVAEIDRRFAGPVEEPIAAIRRAIAEEHEVDADVAIIPATTIPKTSSGKIRRAACRSALATGDLALVAHSVHEAPADDGEHPPVAPVDWNALALLPLAERCEAAARLVLARAARAMGRRPDPVLLTQPLTAWGLDSLRAMDLKNDVERDFGIAVALSDLLSGATCATLGEAIAGRGVPRSPMAATAADGPAPSSESVLSHGQRALWFVQQLSPSASAYNVVCAFRLPLETDLVALQRALQGIVHRHPVLRMTYGISKGQVLATVRTPDESGFAITDAEGWSEDALRRAVEAEAHRPFDLASGPVFRTHLFQRRTADHVLLLAAHHVAVDFWSLETIARELAVLYARDGARRDGEVLPVPAVGYGGFVRWQTELLSGGEGARQGDYWERQLAGAPRALDLPTDFARPPVQTYRGASVPFVVPRPLAAELDAFARAEGVTRFALLLAAFQALLGRYTGAEDVVVGTPAAGRTQAAFRDVVGYFVNPLVLRASLSGDPTFREFLQQVKRTVLAALDHQDHPFSLLVERLQPDRDASRTPLFQAMFALQSTRADSPAALSLLSLGEGFGEVDLGGLRVAAFPLDQRIAQFDLSLAMADSADALAGSLQYNTDLFRRDTMAEMVKAFLALLASIVAAPQTRLRELPVVSDAERQRLLAAGPPENGAPGDATLVELWAQQEARTPDRVALVSAGGCLTYRELDEEASRIATALRGLGVGPSAIVAVCCPRSPLAIAGILGALKAGGAYLPIDCAQPPARIASLIDDARPSAVLTVRALRDRIPAAAGVVLLDGDGAPATESALPPRAPVGGGSAGPRDLAYVIYTSGSTGRPKAVEILHGNVAPYVTAMAGIFEIGENDRVLQFSSLAFDVAVEEIFVTLTSGATLVLRDDEMIRSPAQFLARCGELGITVLDLPTAYWHELVSTTSRDDWLLAGALRLVVIGGEKASVAKLQAWRQVVGTRVRLLNAYGPTETTIAATIADLGACDERSLASLREVPIGRPLPHVTAHVLDHRLEPVPIGMPGELYIGGVGVARGYRNAADLTASRFLPDPFGAPGSRLYRTCDKVRRLGDGSLEFLGRVDQQLKIRGHRIEPGEVEAALERWPGVRDAVVVAQEDEALGPRLVAYVIGRDTAGERIDVAALRAFLRERLPLYMLPSGIVELGAFPLSVTGKLDRAALPPLGASDASPPAALAPRSHAEGIVGEVWRRVLQVERVGVHDNFFDLGGHSLLFPAVLERLEAEFGRSIPMLKLLEHPTVGALAAYLVATAPGTGSPDAAADERREAAPSLERAGRIRDAMRSRSRKKQRR